MNVEILHTKPEEIQDHLLKINPYGTLPTLIDRDLVLYEARIVMEYLDERFPHPPLLPVYPVARAETRKMMHRIEQDWYHLLHQAHKKELDCNAGAQLLDSLIALEPVFADKLYFLSDEFSMLDCALAPLLWRLPVLNIHIPEKHEAIHQYMSRVFKRPAFQHSLTDVEKQMRAA